jgi:hypothetical protein
MLIRDLLVHPDAQRGYSFGGFFDRGPRSFLFIYKLGQARCTFLEKTYGSGTLQTILERSYRLGLGRWQSERVRNFSELVENVTGDKPKKIHAKFAQWVKKRAFDSYLDAEQKRGDFPQLDKIDRYIQGLDSSPDGNILMYKSVDRTTGRNRLFLADRRNLQSETRVVVDGHPRVSSLHPLDGGNFAVHDSEVAFIARARGRDVIYHQDFEVETERTEQNNGDDNSDSSEFEASIDVRGRTGYSLREKGLVTADTVAFRPDGQKIAFVGTDTEGQKDVYILNPETGDNFSLTRVTDDVYAERGITWGDGRLVFASDETGHGRYNLFEVAPEPGAESERLTSAPTDHLEPEILPNGDTYFVAYEDARANLHVVREQGVVRKTDVPTGLFTPSPGPNGGAWALFHYSGRRVPVQLSSEKLSTFRESKSHPDIPARGFRRLSLDGSRSYQPLALKNWRVNNGFGVLGITAGGIFGQLFASASDRLRNHRLLLDFVALGSFERADGALTYMNQENRLIWGASLFQDFRYRVDETLPDFRDFSSFERFYGGRGLLRYPFNQYNYVQFSLAAGGTDYFLPRGGSDELRENSPPDDPNALEDEWQEANDSPRFQTEASVSYGFDSIHYERRTGPLSGSSLLLSLTGDYQPSYREVFASARLDGETYLPIYDRVNVFFRTGAGASFGGRLARQFFLSSFYTLRGVPFQNRLLLGRTFGYSTLELQFPINFLIRIPFVDLEGVVGTDFGGVGNTAADAWNQRVFDIATGVNFGFGPIVLRLHFAKPVDVGGVLPNNGTIVPNLSLGWRYL